MVAKFFNVIVLPLVCLSLFNMTYSAKLHRRVKTRPSPDTKAFCREMKWLDKYQRNLCRNFPEIIELIEGSVKNALTECRRQFRSHRWNCSSLHWMQVFTEGGILRKRSRETAFVQALTAANVMMVIAKACVIKKTKYCGCGSLSRRDRSDVSILSGCGDNIKFGAYLAARFMDPKQIRNHAKKVKRHNHIVGRKVVRQNTQRKCDCLSLHLTGCDHKICRRIVPSIEKVGDELRKLYQDPIRSYWNKTSRRLRISRKATTLGNDELQGKLVYFKKSENFCEPNNSMGIVGTSGRSCNRTSDGHDSCAVMCCGRPYQTIVLFENVKCNCRFLRPCCDIKCDICKLTRVVDTCR